jgi:hypothetical protein
MADERAVPALAWIEQEGDVVDEQFTAGMRDPGAQGMRPDECVQDGDIPFFEVLRKVHAILLSAG